jgi:hypothetical protein
MAAGKTGRTSAKRYLLYSLAISVAARRERPHGRSRRD